MDAAGCDQIVAGGLHITGGLFLREGASGVSLVQAGPGNYVYGQNYRQDPGGRDHGAWRSAARTLVNVRFHPYVMILDARAGPHRPAGRRPLRPRADVEELGAGLPALIGDRALPFGEVAPDHLEVERRRIDSRASRSSRNANASRTSGAGSSVPGRRRSRVSRPT